MLNLCGQINKTQENAMAGTEENSLVLGEPNIIVKVCVSLKRLPIVSFNIKTIRIQSSKCSHPVTFFWWDQNTAFYQQTEPLRL